MGPADHDRLRRDASAHRRHDLVPTHAPTDRAAWSAQSGLGVFRGAARISPTPDGLAHRFELRVLDADPHADAITWPGPSVTQPVDLGLFEVATPAAVLFLRRPALIGGMSGAGKSGGLNVLIGNLTACTDTIIWAIDLKRGMELGPWASCIARLATTPVVRKGLRNDLRNPC